MEKNDVNKNWIDRVTPFATAIDISVDDLTSALEKVVGAPNDEALVILSDVSAVPDADIKAALAEYKIPSGKLNMHLTKLRGEPKKEATDASGKSVSAIQALSILPQLPDDESFLASLKTGGILKVGVTEVLSAVKAALAQRIGLFGLPEEILTKMEDFATKQEEPCGEDFYSMQKLLTERKYGDILSALGVSGSYISEKRKKEFFARLEAKLWPALISFQKQLSEWQQTWIGVVANPAMMMMSISASQTGNQLPAGMMAAPDVMPLRSSGEEVINEINRIFAGTGIPVARALGYDATRIMNILDKKELPAQIGVVTKDQMLKELGINVGADIVRTEQSATRYVLAIMSLPDVPADAELAYIGALLQLGGTIPWDKLGDSKSGIGKNSHQL